MAVDKHGGDMAGQGHDVLIVNRADDLPEQIQERLHAEGYATVAVPDLRDIHRKIQKLKDPLLIIESGSGRDEDVAFLKKLLANEALYRNGIVIVGKAAKSFESALAKSFKAALAVPTPCNGSQVVQALRDVADLLPRVREQLPTSKKAKIEQGASSPRLIDRTESAQSAPDLLFEQLRQLSLEGRTLGGDLYSSKIDLVFLRDRGHLPLDPAVTTIIDTICQDAGKWGRNHLYRTSYLVNCLTDALRLSDELKADGRKAAFLHAWSFAGDREDLLRKNYYREGYSSLRRDLCSKLKDSALKVSSELGYPNLANALAKFARYVNREEQVTDEPTSVLASAVMGADLLDRVCFHSGYWDSRAAYNLMGKLKSGKFTELHPAVLCCLIKITSETIATNPALILLPKGLRQNKLLLERARQAREEEPLEHETKVPISELAPGMKLSRPLYAFDGRRILEEDLTLDQDLVWRIWQLSAVRPLNAPLIVQKKK